MVKKAPQAFRTISEVSKWLDEPAHVLRFWESKFSQIKPVKRAGGRRYYRPSDMKLLGGIKVLLHDEGKTIKSVQEMLKDEGVKKVQSYAPEFDFPSGRKKRKPSKDADDMQPEEALKDLIDAGKVEVQRSAAETPAPSAPVAEHAPAPSPVAASEQPPAAAQDSQVATASAVDTARDRIARAVGAERAAKSSDDAPGIRAIRFERASQTLSTDEFSELEDLYYQLRKTRNRMKRAMEAL